MSQLLCRSRITKYWPILSISGCITLISLSHHCQSDYELFVCIIMLCCFLHPSCPEYPINCQLPHLWFHRGGKPRSCENDLRTRAVTAGLCVCRAGPMLLPGAYSFTVWTQEAFQHQASYFFKNCPRLNTYKKKSWTDQDKMGYS